MDLGKMDTRTSSEEGREMHLLGPDGEPVFQSDGKPVTITIQGSDSATYKREYYRIMGARKGLKIRNGGVKIDTRQAERERTELLAICTVRWDGIDYEGVSPYPCTGKNALKLYTDLDWVRDQVSEFMDERTNYLGEASRDSSSSPEKSSV